MSTVDDWNDGWNDGYTTAILDAIDTVNRFINNPEDDWDKAINNLFIQKIATAIESLRTDQ